MPHSYTALHIASKNGHTDVVELLVKAGGNIEAETNLGDTPLIQASLGGHMSTIELLLSKGADVNHSQQDG